MKIHIKRNLVSTASSADEVAESIITQINTIDKLAFKSWGARLFISVDNPKFNDRIATGKGLQFYARGSRFKGRIIVLLTPNNTYSIIAFKASPNLDKSIDILKEVTDLPSNKLLVNLDTIIG